MTALQTQSRNGNGTIPPSMVTLESRALFNFPGVVFTRSALIIEPGMPLDTWVELGRRLKSCRESLLIWVGDYIRYGKHEYAKKYEEALKLTGYKEGTLRNSVWVAGAVPLSFRDDKLTFKHYITVAPLAAKPETKKEVGEWLNKAVAGATVWSAAKLKKEIDKSAEPTEMKPSYPLIRLHEKAIREELDEKLLAVNKWMETPADPCLSDVYYKIKELLTWQRDRTLENDCHAILKSLSGEEGTEAPDRISGRDLSAWLNARGFIMSKQELGTGGCPSRCTIEHKHIEKSGRLGLMVRLKMFTVETRQESAGEQQSGAVTCVYALEIDFALALDAIEEIPSKPERDEALRKDWMRRLERYAPELLPKKEETTIPNAA